MAHGVRRFFGDPAPIQKNYLSEDFRSDAGDYELIASVHVQVGVAAGEELNETRWLQETSDESGLPSAIVAFCALDSPDALWQLNAQLEFPRVRGVRQIIGRSDAEDVVSGSGRLVENPLWQENLATLGELGLSFDLQLTPKQVPGVADVLAKARNTRIAVCHCGSPWDQSAKGLSDWRNGMRLLASLPNVNCKISGLGMFDHSWTIHSIRPIVESCIEIFGADRAMFGSNFPVDKLHASYSRVWQSFEEIVAGLAKTDQEKLFAGTAQKFYRLGLGT